MNALNELLVKNSERRVSVHVIGDSMIDCAYQGKVTRVSPDSPNINVFRTTTASPTEVFPGGAANVCYLLKNFNADATLFSWVDVNGYQWFSNAGLQLNGLVLREDLPFPVKHRFWDGDIQVGLRWDVEETDYTKEGWDEVRTRTRKLIMDSANPDIIILSDYDKGMFVDELSIKSLSYYLPGVPIIIDPKKGPVSKWASIRCTVFKPNSVEAIELSDGETDRYKQCDYFQRKVKCESVLITDQGKGVYGKYEGRYFEYTPKHYISAHKTIGAGDCFVSVLAVAMAHGIPLDRAAEVAFEAGARYVQQQSREPITLWQLQKQSKFVMPEELTSRNHKLVFTNGCFDILHTGHLESLRFAKSKGDKLVVAVNSDASVSRLKGPKRPVVPLEDRMEMLAALECVDYVVSFDQNDPQELIETIRPDVLIKGEDWKDKVVAGSDVVKEVCFVPLVHDRSTTNMIEKIRKLI